MMLWCAQFQPILSCLGVVNVCLRGCVATVTAQLKMLPAAANRPKGFRSLNAKHAWGRGHEAAMCLCGQGQQDANVPQAEKNRKTNKQQVNYNKNKPTIRFCPTGSDFESCCISFKKKNHSTKENRNGGSKVHNNLVFWGV